MIRFLLDIPGVLLLKRDATISEVMEDLELIALDADDDEFWDQIVSMPL